MTIAAFDTTPFRAETSAPKTSLFKRILNRIVAARMVQVERELARHGYLARAASVDMSDALAPFPSLR